MIEVHKACKDIIHQMRLKKEKQLAENDKLLKEQKKAMRGKPVTASLKPKVIFWPANKEVDKAPDAKK